MDRVLRAGFGETGQIVAGIKIADSGSTGDPGDRVPISPIEGPRPEGGRIDGNVPPRTARTYSRGPKGDGAGYKGPAHPTAGGASAYKKKKRNEESGE